jgi:hypothetical protein
MRPVNRGYMRLWIRRLTGGGTERATGPCKSDFNGATEVVTFAIVGAAQGLDLDAFVQQILTIEEEAVLKESFLVKGDCVDTIRLDADMIQKYVRYQNKHEKQLEQLKLFE